MIKCLFLQYDVIALHAISISIGNQQIQQGKFKLYEKFSSKTCKF